MVAYAGPWANLGASIFTVMTQEANRAGAVNLAQGFPDFDGPQEIKDAAMAAIQAGRNQYAPAPGLPELRTAIAARQAERYGLTYEPDTEVTVFSGATEALFATIMAVCEPGSELVTFEPYYDSYLGSLLAAHATLKPVRLNPPHWSFDVNALAAAITPKTRALLVNTPHNPTGKVFSRAELTKIRDLAVAHDLLVITDEVYEELTFAPAEHVSLATMPGMRERTIVISSTSKTFSFTGWKVGYACAPAMFTQALRAIHQFIVFCSATPLQVGVLAGFSLPADYYREFRASYRQKRDLLVEILTASGFRCQAPEGTYFVMADYSALSDRPDHAFALQLVREHKVAAIPVSPFYLERDKVAMSQRYLRFGFCKQESTLNKAGELLKGLRRS